MKLLLSLVVLISFALFSEAVKCCPVIVHNCRDNEVVGTVIQPFTGWRASVSAKIDWGCTDYTPCPPCDGPPGSRPCTPDDKGFVWYVSWGDGQSDSGNQDSLGPFQVVHQYPHSDRTYRVTVYYCSNPTTDPRDRCCDLLYGSIGVSEDPSSPAASVTSTSH